MNFHTSKGLSTIQEENSEVASMRLSKSMCGVSNLQE